MDFRTVRGTVSRKFQGLRTTPDTALTAYGFSMETPRPALLIGLLQDLLFPTWHRSYLSLFEVCNDPAKRFDDGPGQLRHPLANVGLSRSEESGTIPRRGRHDLHGCGTVSETAILGLGFAAESASRGYFCQRNGEQPGGTVDNSESPLQLPFSGTLRCGRLRYQPLCDPGYSEMPWLRW